MGQRVSRLVRGHGLSDISSLKVETRTIPNNVCIKGTKTETSLPKDGGGSSGYDDDVTIHRELIW